MKKLTSFLMMTMVCCLATFAQWPDGFLPEKKIKIGTAQAKMVPEQWYFIHNSRNPGSGASKFVTPGETIPSVGGLVNCTDSITLMSGTGIIDSLKLENGVIAANYSPVIVRFVPVDSVEGAYNIQYANGLWMGSDLSSISDSEYQEGQAGMYNFYLVTLDGKPNSMGRFAWNKHSMAERVDNNGAGYDVVFWGAGEITAEEKSFTEDEQIAGNNIWQIYDVEILGEKYTSSSEITSGYYTINSSMSWNDGKVKSLYSIEENGTEWLAWGNKEDKANFCWKIETIPGSPTKYRLTNAYTGSTLSNIVRDRHIQLIDDNDATVSFEIVNDEAIDPVTGNYVTSLLIRKSNQNSDDFNYVHCKHHALGAGSNGEAIGWCDENPSCFYLSPVESNDDNIIYAQDANVSAGTEYVLPIIMDNTEDIISFEFELSLPDGISVKQDNRGKYVISLSEERANSHQLLTKELDNGNISIASYSMTNEVFSGRSGVIAYVTLVIDKNIASGSYAASCNNIVMTKTSATDAFYVVHTESTITVVDYILGDVNGDGIINVTDISGVISLWLGNNSTSLNKKAADINKDGIINVIDISGVINIFLGNDARKENAARSTRTDAYGSMYIDPFSINVGETVEVLVNLNNSGEEIVSAEFDLYLPDGIEIATNQRGKYEIAIGSRLDDHQILTKSKEDGAINIAVYSMSNAIFWGTEGDILSIKLKAADDATEGTYKLFVKNQVLTNTNIEGLNPSDSETSIQVGNETGIDSVSGIELGQSIYDMQGRRTNAKQSGVYIMNNKKVIIR